MFATQIKKMSTATVFGKVKIAELFTVDADGTIVSKGEIKVFRVWGRAVGVKTGISNFGEWEALVGHFRCEANDGKLYDSGTLFLPEIALTAVKVALAGNAAADFAIDLFVQYDEKAEKQYVYTFRHIMPPAADDPLEVLQNRIQSLALPAPAPAPEKKEETPTKGKK